MKNFPSWWTILAAAWALGCGGAGDDSGAPPVANTAPDDGGNGDGDGGLQAPSGTFDACAECMDEKCADLVDLCGSVGDCECVVDCMGTYGVPDLAFDGDGEIQQLQNEAEGVCVRVDRRDDGPGDLENTRFTLLDLRVGSLDSVEHRAGRLTPVDP